MNVFQACEGENNHTYLGVPILTTQAKHFDYLVDKVAAKLHPWKARMLSPAAKVVLIKSVVEPLLLYSMGAGWIPESILHKINAKVRAFFWNTGETNKMRMVAWETITKPKQCGGLGLRDTRVLNQAAILRVLWKIASKEFEETLWVRVLSAKYLSKAPLWLANVPSRCSKLWSAVLTTRDIMKPHVQWLLGDGTKCSLVGEPWHDLWASFVHQTGPPCGRPVSVYVDATNGGWDVTKLLQALGFHAALYIACTFQQPPLKPNVRDRLIFKPATSGNFSFKSACNLLEGPVTGGTIADAIWRKVWRCRGILPKIQMFFWKLLHDAILVKATFATRMRTQPPPCDVCGLDVDDAMHALFLCNSSRQCWLASDLGLRVDAMPQQIVQALIMVIQQLDDESLIRFANIIWAVWKARCKEVYEGKRSNVHQVLGNANSMIELSRLIKHSNEHMGSISITVSIPRVQEIPIQGMHCMMDGSFQENARAGWAYRIYRDGVLVKFEVGAEEATSPLHAEVLAFKAAFYAVLKEGVMEAHFYTDCETLVKVLNGVLNPEEIDWRVYLLVVNLILTMQQHEGLVCCHAPRELLKHEHEMANYARRLDICVEGFTFPSFPGITTVG
ncbi:RNA-directed DNA polymerase (reverse transcriptase)-related family protein [Rhynchospora pubera]|uniref:RNA-directed DNA polymerase (Reverse transcriptase)-related family protein n=1 Tax=Rhynchospora pubera TaxID=906938 RepID=A0AAV8H3B9_9POAL|nr:RNA-directed DNA polymerase (reverse transcriptase)-related family protein [Rhynchospora pubera]